MDIDNENDNENEEVEEVSMRDEMEAAINQVDETDDNSGDEYVEETPEIEAKEAKSSTDGNPEPTTNSEKAPIGEGKPAEDGSVKAPVSWSPKLREEFNKLSPSVQAQINKREGEINKFQNDGAESRKIGERMTQTLQPFQAVMSAHGATDPVQAVQGLMNTAATLQTGSPQQKAQKLAEMVDYYGIDINALDNALSGQPNADPQTSALEQMLEQKLAPMQNFMNSVQGNQQQQQQQTQQTATNEVATFEQTAEFIGDVRNDMADLLDMAAKRGQEMSLQQAYDKACAINPEISGVMADRAKNTRITGNQNLVNRKRNLSSSINGRQVGSPSGGGNDSIESLLNQAWDDSSRG